jgi:hypothetical protein
MFSIQIPVEDFGFTPDFHQLIPHFYDLSVQLHGGSFDDLWLDRLGDDQQQDDCAKTTADHIKE